MKIICEISSIIEIKNGNLYFDVEDGIQKIELHKSADAWWDLHHKATFTDILLVRKRKNIYVGDKCWNSETPYIRLYTDGKEYLFVKNGTSDNRELRSFWDDINAQLNKQGFWLFDEG